MKPGRPSKTAQYVALFRAFETTVPGRAPLFQDPYARKFLSRPLDLAVRLTARSRFARAALERYADARAPGARTSAIARTAFLDDVVRGAVRRGIRQLVVLGAGFDCRAHRLPELAGVRVFEVDIAETQAVKRATLGDTGGVTYVPVDFQRDDVGRALAAAGWSATAPSCVLWEGVTNYLTEDAVTQVLAWVGATAKGGTIAFTYIHRGAIDGSAHFPGAAQVVADVRALGEPWTFGLVPEEVGAFVARAGLVLREEIGADGYRRRYLGDGDHAGYAFYRIAVADVGLAPEG